MKLEIKTIEDVRELGRAIDEYGSGAFSEYDFSRRYQDKIIREENKIPMNANYEKLREKFAGDFDQFREAMREHFSQFNTEDKISELIGEIGLVGNYTYKLTPEQVEALKAKGNKYANWATIITLHKNLVRFVANGKSGELTKLFNLLGSDVTIPYFSEYTSDKEGTYSDSAGNTFEIKGNGTLVVKGEIVSKLNKLYYDKYKSNDNILLKGVIPE